MNERAINDLRAARKLLRRYELTGHIGGLAWCRIARLAIAISLVEFFSRLTRDRNRAR